MIETAMPGDVGDRLAPRPSVAVFGLGRLGAPIAAAMAAKGLEVIGVEKDPEKVRLLNQGAAPVYEPGLADLLLHAGRTLRATCRAEEAVRAAEASFIAVQTPSREDGSFSLRFVLETCEQIGRVLRERDDFHVVVLTSTVSPGSTEAEVIPCLERASGKRCGSDFGVCYSPEFVALGSVIRDFLNPDFILIGESDARAGDWLERFCRQVCDAQPPVSRMNLVNAELAKISVNTFVTTKIAFANMLAGICEGLPGADVDTVTAAIGLDTRIGRKYLRGAVSYGGPCFPRDNRALAACARAAGTSASLAEATDHANRAEVDRLVDLVIARLTPDGTVGILGLACKPGTDVVEQSAGLLLAARLLDRGVRVVAYDPAGGAGARRELGERVELTASAVACIEPSDVVVLATAWEEFARLGREFRRPGRPRVVVDCWRMLTPGEVGAGAEYVPFGRGAAPRSVPAERRRAPGSRPSHGRASLTSSQC